MNQFIIFLFSILSILNTCQRSNDTSLRSVKVSMLEQLEGEYNEGKVIEIIGDIDLRGRTAILPHNSVLLLSKGRLFNGQLVGDNTRIKTSRPNVFKNVCFSGSFLGRVNPLWFSIQYSAPIDNSFELNSALNLASISSDKTLVLPYKKYIYVKSDIEQSQWRDYLRTGSVEIKSNVTLDLNKCTIHALPSDKQQYNVLFSKDTKGIVIKNGVIRGEMSRHIGNKGEWGYGIALQGVKNFRIEDIECYECWGDGINIQVSSDGDGNPESSVTLNGHCKDGIIKNVYCHHNRRQGMSIEGIIGLVVTNSRFDYSDGTNPRSGLDIEPYSSNNVVRNVTISQCYFARNAYSGILIMGDNVKDIVIDNCFFSHNKQYSMTLKGENIKIENCRASMCYAPASLRLVGNCKNIEVANCKLSKITAQNFSQGDYVDNIRFSKCIISLSGISNYSDLSDDETLKTCSISFYNCEFDFRQYKPQNGIFCYHNSNACYLYNNCNFKIGLNELSISRSQHFVDCTFDLITNKKSTQKYIQEKSSSFKRCFIK